MKKSKVVKLVFLTGLIGTNGTAFGNTVNKYSNLNSSVRKMFSGYSTSHNGYHFKQDSVKHMSGSSFLLHPVIKRGGWGIFGHHHSTSS
jgi:hypothetical protein